MAGADASAELPLAMKVGTGRGGSVREVIKLVCAAAGRTDVVAVEAERRAGDPAFLCAEVALIKSTFPDVIKHDLGQSVVSLFSRN